MLLSDINSLQMSSRRQISPEHDVASQAVRDKSMYPHGKSLRRVWAGQHRFGD
jgi:hypothetical protein